MLKIGIIGVGGIAQNAHIKELKECKDAKITAICDIDEATLNKVGDDLNLDAKYRFKDYMDLINCDEVDAVQICTPNYLHVEMATAAVKKGKPIEVEKPLGLDYKDTLPLTKALEENPVPNMMCMSYRFKPAVRFAKWIMNKNLIGDIISIDVQYLKSSAFMEGRRLDWRFVKKYAGTGVLGDLAVHLIDLATLLAGDLKKVSAQTKIIVKERKKLDSEEIAPVETDDYCSFIGEMDNGILANFLITRCAIGNVNTIKFDVYATNGVISFNLNNPEELGVCIGEVDVKSDGLHTVKVPKEFYAKQEQSFVDLVNGKECEHLPKVEDGVKLQKILDAILESADKQKWVNIE
ncbi:MAG: Gfo/Idh/MocA family oxidoreductase [Ruminococcaceae bacterium]|nr:Gfo/Idh/MocA family oxidoreductase [Oscillospiraceae bacterium]